VVRPPLVLILVALLGLLVRSFPGPADLEILELNVGQPCTWPPTASTAPGRDVVHPGPELTAEARTAAATFTLQGVASSSRARGSTRGVSIPATPRSCPSARGGAPGPSRRRRTTGPGRTRSRPEPRLRGAQPGPEGGRADPDSPPRRALPARRGRLRAGQGPPRLRRQAAPPAPRAPGAGRDLRQGRDAARGGDGRLGPSRPLRFPRAGDRSGRPQGREALALLRPGASLLGLKTILPDVFQRAFRFRRSRQRVVS